jgi:hypothetical protein
MGKIMKPVHIDENGFVSDDTPEGEKAWSDTYEKMLANGATKEDAKNAADQIKAKMDKVCSNGYEIIKVPQ